jgi:hypothetical protein
MLIKTSAAVAAGTVLSTSAFAQSATEVRGPSRTAHRDALDATHQMRTTMVQTHQPGHAGSRSILPEYIDWKPFPASVRLAIVVGDSTQAEPNVIRV